MRCIRISLINCYFSAVECLILPHRFVVGGLLVARVVPRTLLRMEEHQVKLWEKIEWSKRRLRQDNEIFLPWAQRGGRAPPRRTPWHTSPGWQSGPGADGRKCIREVICHSQYWHNIQNIAIQYLPSRHSERLYIWNSVSPWELEVGGKLTVHWILSCSVNNNWDERLKFSTGSK